jgi:hypothetical protein
MLCLRKLDWLCSEYRVRHRVNNQILHIAHLTQVTHLHRVTWAHSSRVAQPHRVTRGVLTNTSTPHPSSSSCDIIYVDASSPYLGSTSMGNPGVFPTASIPFPGGASTSGNPVLPTNVTQPNPGVSPNF